ncbi:MFS transporter [Herbidospora mongoliensis]|uniref:MFS transporter n=1 Tax=Herbidospora mongoliensis TaxID=688067 RepID=UPI00082ED183|nr:MFS transporter [Herbidospora mongoliensis]
MQAVALSSAKGRWILATTVLGSGMALLDGTVVNVALPNLGRDLNADIEGLQWTINAYTLTLAGLILLGGSLGDRFGRRKVFMIGVVWFAIASALCGLAPSIETLIAARALQGIGGALLTPGSLAIIQATFSALDRPKAVGAWSGLGGTAAAVGPLLGGWIVETIGWRWVFLINLPLAVVVLLIAMKHVPETRDEEAVGKFDVLGAALAAIGLAALTYGLIETETVPMVLGVLILAGFVIVEHHRGAQALVPVTIFKNRTFTAVNVVTLFMYAAMGVVFFLLVLQLQTVSGFPPFAAGSALVPVTLLMLVISPYSGELARRIGPRWPMTIGILLAGIGFMWMSRIGPDAHYLTDVLPPVTLFGLGLSATVAPLTATVLASASQRHAGVASGVNNAVARTGSLLSVAAIPPLVGLTGEAYRNPGLFDAGFQLSMYACAGMMAISALISLVGIRIRF